MLSEWKLCTFPRHSFDSPISTSNFLSLKLRDALCQEQSRVIKNLKWRSSSDWLSTVTQLTEVSHASLTWYKDVQMYMKTNEKSLSIFLHVNTCKMHCYKKYQKEINWFFFSEWWNISKFFALAWSFIWAAHFWWELQCIIVWLPFDICHSSRYEWHKNPRDLL